VLIYIIMRLLDGKKTSQEIRYELQQIVHNRKLIGKKIPRLVAILVGNNGGSLTYVEAKLKACKEIGFYGELIHFDEDVHQDILLKKIDELNNNDQVDGFIVQLPLPSQIDEEAIIKSIDPTKDIDGFHPENIGKMVLNMPCFLPATPKGILELLHRNEVETHGKHCVIIGRSNIVGKPLSILLAQNNSPGNCTVTLTHSNTQNLTDISCQADILITAIGIPNFVTADMVKTGAVVIDVGITRVPDDSRKAGWRLCGDVDFENVAPKTSYITPVPGGVGPMTIAQLMSNTLRAVEMKETKEIR